jgi:hypothetical protein
MEVSFRRRLEGRRPSPAKSVLASGAARFYKLGFVEKPRQNMPHNSITRLRLRSIFTLGAFARETRAIAAQAAATPGFIEGAILAEGRLVFWTRTVWRDIESMAALSRRRPPPRLHAKAFGMVRRSQRPAMARRTGTRLDFDLFAHDRGRPLLSREALHKSAPAKALLKNAALVSGAKDRVIAFR